VLEKAADQLDRLSVRAEQTGGLVAALSAPLGEDADFLRKVEPRQIAARLKGGNVAELRRRRTGPATTSGEGGRPSLLVVLAGAFAAGFLLAKLIEWRSYAASDR
jgi:hypothetical protein